MAHSSFSLKIGFAGELKTTHTDTTKTELFAIQKGAFFISVSELNPKTLPEQGKHDTR